VQHHYRKLLVLLVVIFISACSPVGIKPYSTSKNIPPELSFLPIDVNVTMIDTVDAQTALSKRNLYFNDLGTIKPIQRKQCSLEISAHRGDYRQDESSRLAITAALRNGFNSVEIDIMRLADGNWVNYHDPYTGRAAVHLTGKRMNVERMNIGDWNGLRLRNRNGGKLLNIRPNTAVEAFKVFAADALPGQKLNVEIKSDAHAYELKAIDLVLQRTVGAGNYYYSSMKPDILIKLRDINNSVYLGFIQRPHPESIKRLKKKLQTAGKNDKFYRAHKSAIQWSGKIGSRAYRHWGYKNYTSKNALRKIANELGPNVGLHLDIRDYSNNTKVKLRATKLGVKLYTYSINGPDYHEQKLLQIKQRSIKLLPKGVIVDNSPYHICQRLFGVTNKEVEYVGKSAVGRYINSLPNDADMDRLDEGLDYIDSGYYFSMAGKLRRIKYSSNLRKRINPIMKRHRTVINDEVLNFNNGKPIQINLEIYSE